MEFQMTVRLWVDDGLEKSQMEITKIMQDVVIGEVEQFRGMEVLSLIVETL